MDTIPSWLALSLAVTASVLSAGLVLYVARKQMASVQLFQLKEKTPKSNDESLTESHVHIIEAEIDSGHLDLEEIVTSDDPELVWRIVIHVATQHDNLKRAKEILKAALEHHPSDPRLLIAAGVVWRRLGKDAQGRQYTKQAIKAAEEQLEEFEEQYYLAKSNLAFQLAKEGIEKEEALKAAKLAAEHAGDFDERDSFRINYGYARMRFASDVEELIQALDFLVDLSRDPKLSDEEREEVYNHIEEGNAKLRQLRRDSKLPESED